MFFKKGDLIATKGVVWEVITVNDESSMIITKDIIARLPYYVDKTDDCRGYIDSAIRKWLNEDFLSSLPRQFVDRLLETNLADTNRIEGFGHEKAGLQNEEQFVDKIFLLTDKEAMTLFPNDASRRATFGFDYLRCDSPMAYTALTDAEKKSALSCTRWYLRALNPTKHYVVTEHGSIEQCLPAAASGFELNILEGQLYESMHMSLFEQMLFKNLAQQHGIHTLDIGYIATMIRGQIGLGIRPAAWIKND